MVKSTASIAAATHPVEIKNLEIDLNRLLPNRGFIQGVSGSGKSYLVRFLNETFFAKVQQIIIDPEGEFSSLREKFDYMLVGKDGDIPINVNIAGHLATKLVQTGISTIIDLSEMDYQEQIEFVHLFAASLLNIDKKDYHWIIVYFDEAHLFAPQDKKSAQSTRTLINLAKMGRKRGLCPIFAVHRITEISKDVVAHLGNIFIGRTSLDVDQKRAARALGLSRKEEVLSLRNLDNGEFMTYGPAVSREVIRVKIQKTLTTHHGSGIGIHTAPPTPAAIKKILTDFKDMPQEVEATLKTETEGKIENQQLRAEIRELKASLTIAQNNGNSLAPIELEKCNAELQNSRLELATIKKTLTLIKEKSAMAESLAQQLVMAVSEFRSELDEPKLTKNDDVETPVQETNGRTTGKIHKAAPRQNNRKKIEDSPFLTEKMLPGEVKILTACAQYSNGLARDQLSVLTGYKRSSRDTYIFWLSSKGLVEVRAKRIYATEKGIKVLGKNFKPLPTGRALQNYWLDKLPNGERVILQILIDAYPKEVTRQAISEKTTYTRSSRDTYLYRMVSKEVVMIVDRGTVKAADSLFEKAPRKARS